MTMQTDVKSAHTTGNFQLVDYRTRLKGFIILGSGVAGDIVLYDTATPSISAPELLRFELPDNSNNIVTFTMPGEGIRANNGIYASVPSGASITIIYG